MRITAHESSPHLDLRLRSRFTLIAVSSASRNKNAIAPARTLLINRARGYLRTQLTTPVRCTSLRLVSWRLSTTSPAA
jgi:hypothetical protein